MPPGTGSNKAHIIFFSSFFSFFSPFFPLCSPSFGAISPATGALGSGVGRGLVLPPPSLGGDPWLCHGGPSPRQRWADRAIQQLVTPPVTNRPRLTRMDGSASQADTGSKSGTGSGPQGGGARERCWRWHRGTTARWDSGGRAGAALCRGRHLGSGLGQI